MAADEVVRFLAALSPADRAEAERLPEEKREQLAAAWEAELVKDRDLDTLDELSPQAAEEEAAKRIRDQF